MAKDAAVHQLESKEQQRRISRDRLLEPKIREDDLFIEELGGTVLIRSLSQGKRRLLNEESKVGTDEYDEGVYERLAVILSVVDPVLTKEDVDKLAEQDALVIDKIVMAAQLMNSVGNLDALKKGSSETQT